LAIVRAHTPGLLRLIIVIGCVMVLAAFGHSSSVAADDSCVGPTAIACENAKTGNPRSEWDLNNGTGDPSIVGFTTDISVDHGQTVHFKIKTNATDYRLDIYRLGWYGGDGARKITTVLPSATLPQTQPACLTQPSTGLVDCGNWAESAHWDVSADAVSGAYIAKLVRTDTGGASHIAFVVRNDEGHSALLYQTSDETWEAYNQYGGNSLYVGSPANRAYKVSYNRPFTTRDYANPSFLFGQEYPMLRWLERNGYDMSYTTDVDSARSGAELLEHKVFTSVGHDEYWSAEQRANVEAARAAGVSLAFFSGNEVFWKTRWESSIDGSATPYRTLVSYKETKAGAKIDPSPTWTGTWRDGRFSPPADGGRPENALTGTLFTVDAYRADPMNVPAEFSHLRFWRNTSVATLQAGQVATFPAGVLGHEWDEDVDNGFRPAGLFQLSSTTLSVDKHLIDQGNTYVPGTATQHLMMYRAASGALVFGAGTAQWSWGLDATHDDFMTGAPHPAPDARMQQATVNLLADMRAQPATLQTGLVAATASSDSTAPSSTIASPAAGATLTSGSVVTVQGTAADAGGGTVAAVEVSTDGGTRWHPVTGRESWSYRWVVGGMGAVTLKARAIDDSGNIESAGAGTVVNVACPCSIWNSESTPTTASASDAKAVEVGLKFRSQSAGYIGAIRFYKGPTNTGTHVVSLWTGSGSLLARATATGESASGWQQVPFDAPVAVAAGTTYVASYYAPNGHYAVDPFAFSPAGYSNPPLTALADGADGGNGVYDYAAASTFPRSTYGSSNYWVDVAFNTVPPPDTTPPTVTLVSPADGATGADAGGTVTATFNEAIDPTTVSAASFELRTAGGSLVPATAAYDAASRTAALTPNAALVSSATYTATVRGGAAGVKDLAGNALASDRTWSFTTAAPPSCPCTIWGGGATPQTASVGDSQSVELGVRFRADSGGYITGVRFYKGTANTGTHVGSLWSSSGTLLARATFTNETASGWQQVTFANPVAVTGGTTYVASYHAPVGRYASTTGYFAAATYANSPLRALKDGLDGGNGLYTYSSAASFPTNTYQSSNYWVDVVYTTTPPADSTPPQVSSVAPAAGSNAAAPTTDVTATFNEAMAAATIDGARFQLRNASRNAVAATVSYDAASKTATLHPTAALSYGASYTAVVQGGSGGVTDLAGNPLAADRTWSFSVKSCPCSLWSSSATPGVVSSGDSQSVELGVKFQSDVAGYVTGIRFYKGAQNLGTHVGSLWSSSGTLLARATFASETASGWQQVSFSNAVPIAANMTYVASYHAPQGRYSVNSSYFSSAYANPPLQAPSNGASGGNGVYLYGGSPAFPTQTYGASNYWVDVVLDTTPPSDTTPPTVSSVTPTAADQPPVATAVTATFSEAMDPQTITATRFKLRAGTTDVPADVTYDGSTRTATLHPQSPLQYGTTYQATISGGTGGVTDAAGNALAADYSWTFTTKSCPCSLWPDTKVPQIPSSGDTNPVELGVKFRSAVAGSITGIRFYKGVNNTGAHVGSLWTSTGTLLARQTFTNETATGWQQTSFATPVPIAADTTYVASYFAPNGGWAVDPGFFSNAFVASPLTALANGTDGPNGLYLYGPAPAFPTNSYNASNYSVDVVFTLGP
jgi:Domain of unknown function (DUF4082)/Bacterial Ig-like domain/Bacterial Ig domain